MLIDHRNTPGKLFAAAFALFALAPAAVYFLPDNSNGLIAAQVSAWLTDCTTVSRQAKETRVLNCA